MGKTVMQGIRLLLVISILLSTWFPVLSQRVAASPALPLTMVALSVSSGSGVFTPELADSLSPLSGSMIQEDDGSLDFEDIVQRLQQLTPLFQELYSHLDRSQFDLDDLSASLDYDAGAILDFVRGEIAFEQYPGVLRGELGTLIGRAANAADQALLLRRLLDDAGYETRIARGTLSEAQATLLINQMAAPRPTPPPPIDQAVVDQVLNQLQELDDEAVLNTTDSPPFDPYPFYQDATENDTQLIFGALADANIALDDPRILDELIEEARDYFWVQYRLSAFEPWLDAHPAFTDPAAAPGEISVAEVYRDALPEELYHRFRMEIFVEQKQGGELVVHPILAGWERTSAELVGTPIMFQNQPNNFDPQAATDIETLLANTNLFLPVVNGALADKAFDLNGYPFGIALVGPGAIGATALFQETAGALEDVTGALDALGGTQGGDPEDLITLTAQWIEYTLIAPDGRETTTRRYVMDRVGTANREQGLAAIQGDSNILEASKALLTNHIIMVLPTSYGSAYLTERLLARLLKDAELLNYLRDNPDLDTLPSYLIDDMTPLDDVIFDASLSIASSTENNLMSYLPEPMLLVYQDGIVPGRLEASGFERVDVINNSRRVFRAADGGIQPAPMEAVRQGVWDTYSERALIRDAAGAAFNTFSALRDAAAAGIPLTVLSPEDVTRLQALAHSPETLAAVQRDLEAGYVVIIPERPADESGLTGWWRVDPLTGETLGVTTGGYGQQYVEYLVTFLVSFPLGIVRNAQCRQGGGSARCCFAWGAVASLGAFTVGFHVSALVGNFGLTLASSSLTHVGSLFVPNPC